MFRFRSEGWKRPVSQLNTVSQEKIPLLGGLAFFSLQEEPMIRVWS